MENRTIVQITKREEILELLVNYNNIFIPSIEKQVTSLTNYSSKLEKYAKVCSLRSYSESIGILVYYENNIEMYISLLGIKPERQGKGDGEFLLNYAIRKCKVSDISKIRLEVELKNETAIQFYRKHHFIYQEQITKTTCFFVRYIE